MKYADIRVSALTDDDIFSFLQLLSAIQHLGAIGSSQELKIIVDGDGSGVPSFDIIEEGKTKPLPNPVNSEWFEDEKLRKFYLGE